MSDFILVIQWIGNFFVSWFQIAENNFLLSLSEWIFAFSVFFAVLAIFFKGSGRG